MARLLVMAGSSREGAWSGKLAAAGAAALSEAGASVTPVDLRALALPLYDGDLELREGVPAAALRFRDLVASHDGMLVVTPEYNGFPTPLFVNAFDWLSRVKPDAQGPAGLAATAGKVAGLMSSSPGALGGLRALNFTRQYLQMAFAMVVVPQQFALGAANAAFDEHGALKDERHRQSVNTVVGSLVRIASALHPS